MSQPEVLPREGIQVFIPPAKVGRAQSATGMEVLVAEDDRDVRTLLRLVLRLDGHQVREVPTPSEAVVFAGEANPDLMVLDLTLPGSDGLAILRGLREADGTRELPVLVISGRDRAEDQIGGLEAGADAYLVKPFDPFLFLETVWEITAMSPSQRGDARAKELARLRALAGSR
jgi:DNA-binding response OmpR family regulator